MPEASPSPELLPAVIASPGESELSDLLVRAQAFAAGGAGRKHAARLSLGLAEFCGMVLGKRGPLLSRVPANGGALPDRALPHP